MRLNHFRFSTYVACFVLIACASGCKIDAETIKKWHDKYKKEHPSGNIDVPVKPNDKPDEKPTKPKDQDPVHPGEDPGFPSEEPGPQQEFPDQPSTPELFEITKVSPSSGPLTGGTPFVLSGHLFTEQTEVYFGAQRVDVRLMNSQLVGVSPRGASAGAVDVRIYDPEHGWFADRDAFHYYLPLAVEDVRPERIPAEGGTKILITGSGFTEETTVGIGNEGALSVEYVDGEHLVVTTPPFGFNEAFGALGPAKPLVSLPVTIANKNQVLTEPEVLSYYTPVVVDALVPAEGSVDGGTSIQLQGKGFEPGMTVSFGGVEIQVEDVDTTGERATFTTPPHAAGFVNLSVETSVDQAALVRGYYYNDSGVASLLLESVTPSRGPRGSRVVLTGAGIGDPRGQVFVGGVEATVVERHPGRVVVEIPLLASTTGSRVDVEVVLPADGVHGERRVTKSQAFEYIDAFEADSITPSKGESRGGEKVQLRGSGFSGVKKVIFGGVQVPFSIVDDQTIEWTTPSHRPGAVDVVLQSGDYSVTFGALYNYTETLELYSVTPSLGSTGGGAEVEVIGRGFTPETTVSFGEVPATSVRWVTSNRLLVRTPAHPIAVVDLKVTQGSSGAQGSAGAGGEKVLPAAYEFYNPIAQGGGISGGPIEGHLNVTVYSSSGRPIHNAFVLLSARRETPYSGLTNANGMLTLSGLDLHGEQSISVSAFGYSSASYQRVNARDITVILDLLPTFFEMPDGRVLPESEIPPIDPQEGEIPGGSGGSGGSTSGSEPQVPLADPLVKGYLHGLDKIGIPGPNEVIRAYIFTTKDSTVSDNPSPGPRSILTESGPYEIKTRVGDLAVVALGGLYNQLNGSFKPIAMGIKRYLSMSLGKEVTADLYLDIPTDQTVKIKLNALPTSEEGNLKSRAFTYIDLGYEGVFSTRQFPETTGPIIDLPYQPNLARDLPGATYTIEAGVYTHGVRWGEPRAQSFLSKVEQAPIIQMPGLFGIPEVTNKTEIQFGKGYGKTVNFTLNPSINDPDLILARIFTPTGVVVWELVMPGGARSFQLPDFPTPSGLPNNRLPNPYPPGTYRLLLYAVKRKNFSYDSFDTSRIFRRGNLVGFALSSSVIRFSSL